MTRKAVQIRLMSDDPAAVQAALDLLTRLLPDHYTTTGSAPNRRGPGQRSYGVLLVELPNHADHHIQPEAYTPYWMQQTSEGDKNL